MSEPTRDACGLTQIVPGPLERVPVRMREDQAITSAWRVEATCDQGSGNITRVDVSPGQSYHRGEGLFLGWPQERLAELYQTVIGWIDKSGSDIELLQLG